MTLVEALEHLFRNLKFFHAGLVALGFLLKTRQGALEGAHVGQDELGFDGFDV